MSQFDFDSFILDFIIIIEKTWSQIYRIFKFHPQLLFINYHSINVINFFKNVDESIHIIILRQIFYFYEIFLFQSGTTTPTSYYFLHQKTFLKKSYFSKIIINNKMTLFILTLFQTYIPIVYAIKYMWYEDKNKVQSILKFQVINGIILCIKLFLSLLIQQYFMEIVLIFPYLYLTIYDYSHAASIYNLLILPISDNFKDEVILKCQKLKIYADKNQQTRRKKSLQQKFYMHCYNLFNPEQLFLIKQAKKL